MPDRTRRRFYWGLFLMLLASSPILLALAFWLRSLSMTRASAQTAALGLAASLTPNLILIFLALLGAFALAAIVFFARSFTRRNWFRDILAFLFIAWCGALLYGFFSLFWLFRP